MQRVLMGSLDSRLHPTDRLSVIQLFPVYRPTLEAPIWKCLESDICVRARRLFSFKKKTTTLRRHLGRIVDEKQIHL